MNMRIDRSIGIGIGGLLIICIAALVTAGWTGLTSTATALLYENDDGTFTQIVCVDGIITTVTTGTWEELEETPLNSPPAGRLIPFLQSRSSSTVYESDDGSLTQITCANGIITVTTMEEMFAASGETPF